MEDNTMGTQPSTPDRYGIAAVTGLARVRLLGGHVDALSADVVEDHPYGGGLRCWIRYWIDTDTRRGHAGWQRFVSQTTNPRRPGQPWNHPKESTYAPRIWMYLDGDRQVQRARISQGGVAPHTDAWLRIVGIYDQMTDTDRHTYDELLRAAQAFPDGWDRWHDTVAFLVDYLAEHRNEPPEASNGSITRDGRPFYIGDDGYPIAVAVARLRLTGLTVPGLIPPGADQDGS
jgi:hypothetical protein